MINRRVVLRTSFVLVAVIAILLVGIVLFQSTKDDSSYPDFNKPVYITAKYSNLAIDIELSPDHTCKYSLSNDANKYRGKWEILSKGKAVEINVDLTYEGISSTGDTKKIEGSILIYDSKKGNYLAAVPYDVMNMQDARIYGKWKQ